MLIICGALVNGPYALITTAVSADLVSAATSRKPGVTLGSWSGPLSPGPFPPEPFPRFLATQTRSSESFRIRRGSPPLPFLNSEPQHCLSPGQSLSGLLLGAASGLGPHSALSPQGTHKSLKGNAKALSTVTAIIDGTGSIGLWLALAPGR